MATAVVIFSFAGLNSVGAASLSKPSLGVKSNTPISSISIANGNNDAKLKKSGYKKTSTVSSSIKKMEAQGINVRGALGENQYRNAIVNFRGGTYIKRVKGGFKIALNSAVCKTIIWGGAGACVAAIGGSLTSIGLGPVAINAISAVIYGALTSAGAKATKHGVYVTCTRKRIAHHHKHHKTTYTHSRWHVKLGYQK